MTSDRVADCYVLRVLHQFAGVTLGRWEQRDCASRGKEADRLLDLYRQQVPSSCPQLVRPVLQLTSICMGPGPTCGTMRSQLRSFRTRFARSLRVRLILLQRLRLRATMASLSDLPVAIVGARPYGLSVAAHLRSCGVPFRIFGRPMRRWRE